MSDQASALRIRAESSHADPDIMRFVLDQDVQAGASVSFAVAQSAAAAPLGQALFAIAGVQRVDVSGAVIGVIKVPNAAWEALKRPIAAAIRAALGQPDAPLGQKVSIAGQPRSDAEILVAVQLVLDSQANPAIASHGGHVAVAQVQNAVVSLRMSGGCQGCSASAATLRDGVEKMIRAAVPEVRHIVDVTNHDAGKNPYYSGGGGSAGTPKRPGPLWRRPVPPEAIEQSDGQFLISPDYLAPRLGMDPETLRAALHSGEVVSRSEAGLGEDAGKTRIIVRSSQRAWAAEITPDGEAYEIPPPRPAAHAAAGSSLRARVRAHLAQLSVDKVPVT